MPNAIEMKYLRSEFPVPPDVRPIGTLIRFPLLTETSHTSLRALSMLHGTMTLFFPKPNATDVRISFKIDTFGRTNPVEGKDEKPAVSIVQLKDGTFLYPKERFVNDGVYPLDFRSHTFARLVRDGISQVEIIDRTQPVDILLNEEDTLLVDMDTPEGIARVMFRDFTPHRYHHTALTFIETGMEYHANYDSVRAIQANTGVTLCVVQIL